jgi:branched-chain amino acid transport system permease protein
LTLPPPSDFQTYALQFYYFTLALMIGACAVSWSVRRSRFGLGLFALNMDRDAAETIGVDTTGLRLRALMLSAFMVGVCGSIYAQSFLFIDPGTVFGFSMSIAMVLMPTIGGIGTLWGPVIGAVIFKFVEQQVSTAKIVVGGTTLNLVQFNLLLYGALLVAIVLFEPRGVVGMLEQIARWIRRRNKKLAEPTASLTAVPRESEEQESHV